MYLPQLEITNEVMNDAQNPTLLQNPQIKRKSPKINLLLNYEIKSWKTWGKLEKTKDIKDWKKENTKLTLKKTFEEERVEKREPSLPNTRKMVCRESLRDEEDFWWIEISKEWLENGLQEMGVDGEVHSRLGCLGQLGWSNESESEERDECHLRLMELWVPT